MKYDRLRQIKPLFFSYGEVADWLDIKPESAKVFCTRYYSRGLLVRVKRNIYALRERWNNLTDREAFQIANVIQVPSYISLTTALAYYGYTTQVQRDFIESICVTRTYNKKVGDYEFNYSKITKKIYSGFSKRNQFFIASPEKALADGLYLTSLGRYSLDFSALEYKKFNPQKIDEILVCYPENVKKIWEDYEAN